MKDRYNDFEGYLFHYKYPFNWVLRNKRYMKKTFNRRPEQEFMTPPDKEYIPEDCERGRED